MGFLLTGADFSLLTYVLVFVGGLGSGLSPCTLPTVLLIVSYVGGKKELSKLRCFYISLFFILGIAATLSLLGFIASFVGGFFLSGNLIWYIVSLIAIIMGLYLLDFIKFDLNFTPSIKEKPKAGFLGAFLLGLPFGVAASPCTLPVTATVLAFSATSGSVVTGSLLLFVFAIGRSIPLLLAGTFTGAIKNFYFLQRWSEQIQKLSGLILIGIGFYFIWTINF